MSDGTLMRINMENYSEEEFLVTEVDFLGCNPNSHKIAIAEEVFRHKTLKKFKKAVNRRMAQSQYNTPNIFDLMEDEDTDSDKKKKKKDKDKDKKKKKKSHDFGDSFASSDDSDKKKKKKNKEDREAESEADKRAQELYKYHLEKAMSGEYDRKGYKFEF